MRTEAADPLKCWHGVPYFTNPRRIPFDACKCCWRESREDSYDLCWTCRTGPASNIIKRPAPAPRTHEENT